MPKIKKQKTPQREYWIQAVNSLIKTYGKGHVITRSELKDYMLVHYGIEDGSFHPTDYCYNSIDEYKLKHPESFPQLFVQTEDGGFECVGQNYPYTGPVYHNQKRKNQPEKKVAEWKNGKCTILDPKYEPILRRP